MNKKNWGKLADWSSPSCFYIIGNCNYSFIFKLIKKIKNKWTHSVNHVMRERWGRSAASESSIDGATAIFKCGGVGYSVWGFELWSRLQLRRSELDQWDLDSFCLFYFWILQKLKLKYFSIRWKFYKRSDSFVIVFPLFS